MVYQARLLEPGLWEVSVCVLSYPSSHTHTHTHLPFLFHTLAPPARVLVIQGAAGFRWWDAPGRDSAGSAAEDGLEASSCARGAAGLVHR